MTIIRLKLKPELRALVVDAASENGLPPDHAQDVFALFYFDGNGIPDKSKVAKMAKKLALKQSISSTVATIAVNQRRSTLITIAKSAPFAGFVAMKKKAGAKVFDLYRRLLQGLVMLAKKTQAAQCLTCPHKTNCDFGKQYGERVLDIRKVIDPEFNKKVHPDCPHRPDLGMVNLVNTALHTIQDTINKENEDEGKVAARAKENYDRQHDRTAQSATQDDLNSLSAQDEDPDLVFDTDQDADMDEAFVPPQSLGGRGQGDGRYKTTHTGSNIIPPDDAIKRLSVSQLLIFELGAAFDRLLSATKKGKFGPSPVTQQDKRNEDMKNMADIVRAVPSAAALPEEILEAKIDRKKLDIRKDVQPEEKKKILYLLIDSSGSMSTWLNRPYGAGGGQSVDGALTRSELAMVLTLSLLKRVERDKGIVYIRFFESSVSRLIAATEVTSYEEAKRLVSRAGFNGGGTNILGALSYAANDIAKANSGDTLHEAEILLITDAEDSMSAPDLKSAVLGCGPNVKAFNVLDVSGKPMPSQEDAEKPHFKTNAALVLKSTANKYFKASGQTLDPAKIIDLI